jgi:hypothetical protein
MPVLQRAILLRAHVLAYPTNLLLSRNSSMETFPNPDVIAQNSGAYTFKSYGLPLRTPINVSLASDNRQAMAHDFRSLRVRFSGRISRLCHFAVWFMVTTNLPHSWEFLTTLGYEWDVIRGRLPYRWTIWVRTNIRITSFFLPRTLAHGSPKLTFPFDY